MEGVRGGVSGRTLIVNTEWGESGSAGGILGRGYRGSSGVRDERESTAGSVNSCVAYNSLCVLFGD